MTPTGPLTRLRTSILVAAGVTLAASSCGAASPQPVAGPSFAPSADWTIVFEHDFDADRLDLSAWNLCHWWDEGDGCQIGSSGELEWYLPEQVAVTDGTLVLTADASTGRDRSSGHPYVSGMVSTGPPDSESAAKSSFTYGAVEVRVRMPRGAGLWPAIWMLPESTKSRPEIDIVEMYGDSPDVMRMHLHWSGDDDSPESLGDHAEGTDLTDGWHTVGVLWRRESVVWYLDGVEQWQVTGPQVPAEPMYLVMNLAVGGDRAGAPTASTQLPAQMRVDWVRVWQQQ